LVDFLRNRNALALQIERLGKAHPDLGESWGNLAELLYDAGRFAEAERAYRETLAVYGAALPPGHVYLRVLDRAGQYADRAGSAGGGGADAREAVALRIDKVGADDRRTAKGQRMLGLCLAALGQRAEAEQILLDSYRTLSEARNWYHRTLGNAVLQDPARLYRSWGEPAKAGKLETLLRSRS
jgi:tetratricopeptide (TPR) repeat protein